MVTENTKLARLIGEVLRLSDEDVESDERWAGVAELRQLDPEQIFEIAAGVCGQLRFYPDGRRGRSNPFGGYGLWRKIRASRFRHRDECTRQLMCPSTTISRDSPGLSKAMTDNDTTPSNAIPLSVERNLLDHYFAKVHNKLDADALLFNRQLPHSGLVGTGNEQAIGDVLREFLPMRFGIEVNAMVIDRFGKTSKQADIVIYDTHNQANFLRKVFPVEMVYAVIEVKTSMSSTEASSALENLKQ
jgi:hypothetical protein